MSLAFPNGQQQQVPSIIASFADGHPSTNQDPMATNADSFSGGAAFSFDHHNQTPLFGVKTDTQNQMQTQSANHLMVDKNQIAFIDDYAMDTAKDTYAPRDEDFDIDLDVVDERNADGDIDLELATPLDMIEDDLQMGGVGAAEPVDDEMFDDPTAEIHNEEMLDDDLTLQSTEQPGAPIQQQPQPGLQQPERLALQPSLFSVDNGLGHYTQGSPIQLNPLPELVKRVESPFEELAKRVEERRKSLTEQGFIFPPEPVQPEPSISQPQIEEAQPNQAGPLAEAAEPAELTEHVAKASTPPQVPSPQVPSPEVPSPTPDQTEKPLSPKMEPVKQQTPPGSNEAVRISQADTVTLENPTPEVNQREWNTFTPTDFGGRAAPLEIPPEPTYHPEIPTSPFQPSEHESHSPASVFQPGDQSLHEPDVQHIEEAGKDDHRNQDALRNHPVIILYRDLEFSLFPVSSEGPKLADTSFLPDRSVVDLPLSKLVASLRDVLGDQFSTSEEIVLTIGSLGFEFEEENSQINHITLYELIGLFVQLLAYDGVEDVTPLYISLSSRQRYLSKLEMIKAHIAGGGGLFSWTKASVGLDNDRSLASEPQRGEPHHDYNHAAEATEPAMENHTGQENTNQEELEDNGDELELEEYEKHFDVNGEYYSQEAHEVEQVPPGESIANIDVPRSPSQESPHRPQPTLARDNTTTEGSLNVPETQYTTQQEHQHPAVTSPSSEDIPAAIQQTDSHEDVSSIHGDHDQIHNNAHLSRDDEASFVTAQEKQQHDTSRVQSLSHTGSYGIPASPSSDEDEGIEYPVTNKGIANLSRILNPSVQPTLFANSDAYIEYNFDLDDTSEHPGNEEEVTSQENQNNPEEETKSSSTLHEASEHGSHGEVNDEAADNTNWTEWAYVEDEVADYYGEDEEHTNEATEGGNAALDAYDGLPTFAVPANGEDEEYDVDEFAFYPQQFSDFDNPDESYDPLEDPNLGLEQHETNSTTASTKRAREDDDFEEEDSDGSGEARNSPSQGSSIRPMKQSKVTNTVRSF
ncbi:hypothetical protein ABW19_dt0210444 [Dactylella cylindrospora]|nr:hypothetical protein ABW19_dt0210444 [Dactylella cylindrospora]